MRKPCGKLFGRRKKEYARHPFCIKSCMKHIDLFSGIGGFALAADRVFGDVEHTFCEIDPFCQEVLKKHWPNSKIYGDIDDFVKELTGLSAEEYNSINGLSTWRQILERNPDVYERDVGRGYSGVLWDNPSGDVDDIEAQKSNDAVKSPIRDRESFLERDESKQLFLMN